MNDSSKARDVAFALMRVILGLLFACHGAQKLLGVFGGHFEPGVSLKNIGGGIELVGGLLIAAGLFTRIAAFLCSGTMAVAYFKAHAPGGFWPIENHGELAVVYCFVFLYLSTVGGGRYSLDAKRRAG